jgi:hypothetical protein
MNDAVVRVARPRHLRLVPDLPDDDRWEDDPSGLVRALLLVALSASCWGLLASGGYAVYTLLS